MNLIPEMPLKGGITIKEDSLKGEVKFNNVSFVYPTRPDQVLKLFINSLVINFIKFFLLLALKKILCF